MSTTRMLNEAFAEKTTSEDKRTPLEKHIDYCGGVRPGEAITYTSMVERNKSLGDSGFTANSTAAKVSLAAGVSINHCPFSQFTAKDAVGKLNHPQHTGIFNLDGTINEQLWNVLCCFTNKDSSGTTILNEKRFYDFLDVRRQYENSSSLFGKLASNAEWGSYWEKFSTTHANGERYVTLKKLREFFEDTSKPGQEVEERIRHSKKNTI